MYTKSRTYPYRQLRSLPILIKQIRMIAGSILTQLRKAWPLFLVCIALTITAIIGQTWWAIAQDRALTIEQETISGVAAVRSIEEHATRTLKDAERAVGAIIDTIREDVGKNGHLPPDQSLRGMMIRQRQESVHIQSLRYINTAGWSTITTTPLVKDAIDLGNRKYIRELLDSDDPHLTIVGSPVKSRADNQWILPLARNLYDLSGRRLGIIAAYINITYFSDFYQRIATDRHAVVSLYTGDGIMIIRSPYEDSMIGQDISSSSLVHEIARGVREGVFLSKATEQEPRRYLYAYRTVGTFPVVAVHARELDEILVNWRDRSENRIAFAGATIALIGILTTLLMSHIRQLQQSERRLTASETRYRALYESATDGIVLINRAREYVDCNPAALRMFDIQDKQQIVGKKTDDFSPLQSVLSESHVHTNRLTEAAFDGTPQSFEWSAVHRGMPVWNEVTLSLATIDDDELLFCVFRDINSRKNAELLQQGQNLILHLIGTDSDLQQILRQIVRFIEEAAPHVHALILLVDDNQYSYRMGVGSAMSESLISQLTMSEIGVGKGAISEAVLTNLPVVVEDLTGDVLLSANAGIRSLHRYRSSGSWPIMSKRGQLLGVLSLFYGTQGPLASDDMLLVGIGTDLAAIAIEGRIADDRIRQLAHYDELTGLPNRFLYTQHLVNAISHAERHDAPVGVLFLDLDRFKYINDSFGHVAGDAVLREVAMRFKLCLREVDIIARVGGDEFIVLVDQFASPLELGEIARRLLAAAIRPFEIDGQECQLSVSIGIASYPQDGINTPTLLKHADIAMYRAKATGKNNYQFYSAEMNTHSVDRLALEAGLRRAIERCEFVVHYQPKIDIATGIISGAEALVRWNHPERGLLFPLDFIDLAEEAGLIGAIGMQVVEKTCTDIGAFKAAAPSFGRVAINLSASQFNEANLLTKLRSVVESRKIDPTFLEFEITESMVMNNREQAIELMDSMRELGFSLSIDDFGTGYSSLAYLKRFPVDSVKVDKSFINDIPDDVNDSAIVQAIIVMAHTLGLKVTAEGVETATQLAILRSFGCDEYQGYYFSKPVPAEAFLALLKPKADFKMVS